MAIHGRWQELQEVDVGDVGTWPYWLKLTGVIMVGLLILLLSAMYLYSNQITRIQAQGSEIDTLKQQLVFKHRQAASLPLYTEQLEEIEQRFDVVSQQLPNETEIPSLLTDISQAGIDNGLEFQRFQPKVHVEQDFFVKVPIQIKASGSYHQLAEFVSDIANFPRIVTIGDFSMSRDRRVEDTELNKLSTEPSLAFDAEIITYHYQADSSESGDDAGTPRVVK